jgi:hypothetical protein
MEFELTEDQVKDLALSEEQLAKVVDLGKTTVATIAKSLDDKYKEEANKNAEGILTGAAKLVEQKTGIARNQGEKLADYLERTGQSYFTEKETQLEKLKKEYEEKIEGVKDGAKLKLELEKYQKRVAELEPINTEYTELKTKFDTIDSEYSTLKINTAFDKAMPKIPEGVNEFEKKARLDAARNEILTNFDLKFDDKGVPYAVNKSNEFDKKPLSEVLAANESIKAMIDAAKKDDNKGGFGGTPKGDNVKIDGVPFEVTDKMTSEERTNAIREYLEKQGVSKISVDYAKRFAELNSKILAGLKK